MFEHIYVENKAKDYLATHEILGRFPHAQVIEINHYKDIFNRRGQSFLKQKSNQSLILAVNTGELIFEGARTCQDFGSEHFYYTSQVKNCIYDCEYCYLQGMYPSGNIVVFVNTEDYFSEVDRLTENHRKISLSIAYDTDLLALEGVLGFVEMWCDYARKNHDVFIEIRTKCGSTAILDKIEIPENIVLAYTISPEEIASAYEHGASSYTLRKNAVYTSLEKGIKTRICFDPAFPIENFEAVYGSMLEDFFSNPIAGQILDVSLGSFRISKEFIKAMQGVRLSPITTYPYVLRDGICTFEAEKLDKMMCFMRKIIIKYIDGSKIYVW